MSEDVASSLEPRSLGFGPAALGRCGSGLRLTVVHHTSGGFGADAAFRLGLQDAGFFRSHRMLEGVWTDLGSRVASGVQGAQNHEL